MRISDWSSDVCSSDLVIGVVNVIFTLVAITQSDKFGRKPLLVVGLIGMVISLVTVGVCFYTGYTDGVLVLGMLVLFIACRSEERRVGKECVIRVDLGGRRIIKKKNNSMFNYDN